MTAFLNRMIGTRVFLSVTKFVEAHFDDVFVEYANNSGHFVHVGQPELAIKFINQDAHKWLIRN